jgi:uncharacterized protein (DUF2235 family)
MPKNILIFSDGTGQIGGMRPDQRLSNVYKLYNAMRPGPFSTIRPSDQVAFYDPGLGAGEVKGLTFRKIRNMLEAAVGTGIDDNVIDCYERIISYYEQGDRVFLFGFSRGAYTVRSVANVMNLCGIPTRMPDGSAVPKYGANLRKIAIDAVKYVYNHGAGHQRAVQPFLDQREEKGRRFRRKYASFIPGANDDSEPNVQPHFIGVFDTVAALSSSSVTWLVRFVFFVIVVLLFAAIALSWSWPLTLPIAAILFSVCWWYAVVLKSQFKYFSPNANQPLKFSNPLDWYQIYKYGHRAVWSKEHYDLWLDSEVQFARHALAIDEQRADFPRVGWGLGAEADKTAGRNPTWLKQLWFAGCHSDIGGSYLESESRLSDIALDWMVDELKECAPEVKIREELLVRSPDPLGLQHQENFIFEFGPFKKKWKIGHREIHSKFGLHPSVVLRLAANAVPQDGEIKPYRPHQLKDHPMACSYY